MAAPSISRTRLRNINSTAGITGNLAGGTAPNASSSRLRISALGAGVVGTNYWINVNLDEVTDFTNKAFAIAYSLGGGLNNPASATFGLGSASGTRLWNTRNGQTNILRTFFIDPTLEPYAESGTFDITAVTHLRWEWTQQNTGSMRVFVNDYPYSWVKDVGPSLIGGETGNEASLTNLGEIAGGFPNNTADNTALETILFSQGNYSSLAHSITINADEILALNGALIFPDNSTAFGSPWILTGPPTVNLELSSGEEFSAEIVAANTAKKFNLVASGNANLSLNLVRPDAVNVGDCNFEGRVRQGQGLCQGGVTVAAVFQDFVAPHAYKLTTADITGSRFINNTGAILIQDAGTYSLASATFSGNTANVTVDGVAATLELSAAQFDSYSSNPANFPIATIGGGSVTVTGPVTQIVLSNIPQVLNALVGVINLATMGRSYPAIVSGVANIPTDPETDYLIAVDAPGWIRQQVILSGSTPAFTLDWTGRDFRYFYDQGDPSYVGTTIDYETFEVLVDDSLEAVGPATAFRRIEDLLSNIEAIFFPNPPTLLVVQLSATVAEYYLVFPYDAANEVVNPVVIKPHPDNTVDVSFVGFSILLREAENPFYDIFDFTEQPNGRIIRIETKSTYVVNQVTGGGGSGLGPEDIARLERIEQQLIADVSKGADRYKRFLPGTETVILDKDVSYDPMTGFTLVEHQEPPP